MQRRRRRSLTSRVRVQKRVQRHRGGRRRCLVPSRSFGLARTFYGKTCAFIYQC